MSKVRTRLEQYKAEIEKKSQYKHGLPGSALDIVNTLLNDLEQDEKENGWIPCSERLPEESDYYMACVYDSEANNFDFRKTWFAHKDDYYIDESEWRELYQSEKVTAWRPLPDPYKGD